MNLEALDKILGGGLLQDGQFGDLIRQHFPDAAKLDLYGAGVTFNQEGQVVAISCKGREVRLDAARDRSSQEKS